jgi:hypothetical protein
LVVVVVGGVDVVELAAEGDGFPPSDPDEQPARTTENTAVATVAARVG